MRSLHIIMPMAGEGTRFLKEGWTTPKPLIELKGIPLFVRAIRSVIMDDINLKYSFIVRQDPNDSVIVMDCDLEFSSKAFLENIRQILAKPVDEVNGGLLVSFESDLPKYSYAEIDANNIVRRTAEKEVISNHALCGAYFFSSGKGFLKVAHQLLDNSIPNKSEFYVSLLYNYLLKNGETVKLCLMENYYSYGTPEELKRYM